MGRDNRIFDNLLILIAGIGSVVFILVPYVYNLFVAASIKKRLMFITENESTKSFFFHNSKIFTILVVLTGGAYHSLVLISSKIFGLSVFSSGLTAYELKQLSGIRIFGTVFLENCPQMTFQLLYTVSIGTLSNGVIFAFLTSFLSVLSAVLSHVLDKDELDTKVVKYYLTMQKAIASPRSTGDDNGDTCTISVLKQSERISILKNMGRRNRLSIELSELFAIPKKNLQVGNSIVSKYGVITYIVHFINDSDLKQISATATESGDCYKVKEYMEQLYASCGQEINAVFQKHFGLDYRFDVSMNYVLSLRTRAPTKDMVVDTMIQMGDSTQK